MKLTIKKSKHTPAPWSYSGVPGDQYIMAREPNARHKFNVAIVCGTLALEDGEADAYTEVGTTLRCYADSLSVINNAFGPDYDNDKVVEEAYDEFKNPE